MVKKNPPWKQLYILWNLQNLVVYAYTLVKRERIQYVVLFIRFQSVIFKVKILLEKNREGK